MRRILVLLSLGITVTAAADDKPLRIEGFAIPGVVPKAADGDGPLAEGWPKATAPGAVEVKDYPAYRSAVARGKGASLGADSVLFFPLFAHISRSKIEMTVPVVTNYSPEMIATPKAPGDASMEFVYRTADLGKAGPGVGAVKVEDHPAATFVCLGVQGEMDPEKLRRGVAALKGWLGDHRDRWVADDRPARLIAYHGPMTPTDERLQEIQVGVKSAPAPGPGPASAPAAKPGG